MAETDYCSMQGAWQLAEVIRDYWDGRGFHGIAVGIEKFDLPGSIRRHKGELGYGYRVVSNINGSGYPPRESK